MLGGGHDWYMARKPLGYQLRDWHTSKSYRYFTGSKQQHVRFHNKIRALRTPILPHLLGKHRKYYFVPPVDVFDVEWLSMNISRGTTYKIKLFS